MHLEEQAGPSTGAETETTAVLTHTLGAADEPSRAVESLFGARLGRFILAEFLGEGASGRVYVAHDTILDRTVAIKLLRASASDAYRVQERLLGEARALARLSHTNVVQIYDVGVFQSQIYLALEHIDGVTLRAWQRGHADDWRAIVAMYCQCGEGLAAAHKVGLVHRDFKPENVMVSKDGRAHVLDFGLAGLMESTDALEGRADGQFEGTPGYMAPEQYLQRPTDARGDQFSFCVALYEALYQVRPFAASTIVDQRKRVLAGEVPPAPARTHVPPRLMALVRRGLAVDPEQRWPDIQALLIELDKYLRPSRSRGLFALAAAAAVIGGVLWTYRSQAPSPCSGGPAEMAALWTVERQAALHPRFLRVDEPEPARAWQALWSDLERTAARWPTIHHSTCEAHRRLERTDAQYESQLMCLHVHKVAFAALLEGLEKGPRIDLERAQEAILNLPDVERCADFRDHAQTRTHLFADAKVMALRDEVTRALTLSDFQSQVTRADTEDLTARARASGDSVALIGALAHEALEYTDGPASEAKLVEALMLAEAIGDDEAMVLHGPNLVHILGYRNLKFREALVWARMIEAKLERIGGSARQHYLLLSELSAVYQQQNEFQRALATLERARDLVRDDPTADGGMLASGPRMAALQLRLGAFTAAEATLAEVEPLLAGSAGKATETYGSALRTRGYLLLAHDRPEEAYKVFAELLDLLSSKHGPASAQAGLATGALASALRELGQLDAAYDYSRRTTEIYRQAMGSKSRLVARGLMREGRIALLQGHPSVAERALTAALTILGTIYEAPNTDMVEPWCDLGLLALRRGDAAEAGRLARSAIQVIEGTLGGDHPSMAEPLVLLAESALHRGDAAQAAAHADLAVAAVRQGGADASTAGRAYLVRARARDALTGPDAQVRADASAAEALLVRFGDPLEPLRAAAAALFSAPPGTTARRRRFGPTSG